jgi:hypothetical protein
MRHSSLNLTMHSARERRERTSRKPAGRVPKGCDGEAAHNVCTEPALLDVARALEALPDLALGSKAQADAEQAAQ